MKKITCIAFCILAQFVASKVLSQEYCIIEKPDSLRIKHYPDLLYGDTATWIVFGKYKNTNQNLLTKIYYDYCCNIPVAESHDTALTIILSHQGRYYARFEDSCGYSHAVGIDIDISFPLSLDNTKISFSKFEDDSIEIYTLEGRYLLTIEKYALKNYLRELPKGLYLVKNGSHSYHLLFHAHY